MNGGVGVFIMLYLSAALATIDHAKLLDRLETNLMLVVIEWLSLYLGGRAQTMCITAETSERLPWLNVMCFKGQYLDQTCSRRT